MKKIILILLAATLQSCNGQEKNKTQEAKTTIVPHKPETSNEKEGSIDFLDIKYQSNGFFIPDNPDPYPTYSFSDKKTGIFSVDFIGKTNEIQNFWNSSNKNGYFSKTDNPEKTAQDSKAIKTRINEKDYYIVASHLPTQFINYTGGEDGEFEPKEHAKTTFYLFKDNSWKQIGEIETSKIPENVIAFETSLIQKEIFKNIKSNLTAYKGSHSVSVETEATTTGMASISYDFTITKTNVSLSLNTYKEPIVCEGKHMGIEKNNQLEIYYWGEELSCVSIDPKFIIKKDKNQLYIKGIGGEATYNKWILMN